MQPQGFGVTERKARQTKSFNRELRYVQGFRTAIAASSITPATLTLNAAGRFLLGIAVYPITGVLTTLGDTRINFIVNNNNLLLNVGANSLNPNFVQNMMFFPTPQPLSGTDSILIQYDKQDAGAATVYCNVFYIPRV